MRKAFFIINCLLAMTASFIGRAQVSVLQNYFAEVRRGNNPTSPSIPSNISPEVILNELMPFLQDTVGNIRLLAHQLVEQTGLNAKASSVHQHVVDILVEGLSDEINREKYMYYLTRFNKEDFTSASRDKVRVFFTENEKEDQLLQLVGFLELSDLQNEIRNYSYAGNSQSLRWAALLSLSRIGDLDALNEVMVRVRRLPVSDDLVYDIFPDLMYIRHPVAIGYMVEVMRSDEKNCLGADAETELPIPCGYRVMEQLAGIIEDYPLKLEDSGDVKTKNYASALITARTWFDKHPDFEVNRSTY